MFVRVVRLNDGEKLRLLRHYKKSRSPKSRVITRAGTNLGANDDRRQTSVPTCNNNRIQRNSYTIGILQITTIFCKNLIFTVYGKISFLVSKSFKGDTALMRE